MHGKILVSGAFDDASYRFSFFERIAEALEREGAQVERFNAFGFARTRLPLAQRLLERLFTLPGRLLGIGKDRIRAALPWTPEGRRERALIDTVRRVRPDTLIVVRGFAHRPRTLRQCRRLGVQTVIGWYVEGPLEPGLAEAESRSYDRYFCIHTEIAARVAERIGWLPSYGLDAQTFRRTHWPRSPQNRIVFVGTPTARRVRYLEVLTDLPLELWGPKWAEVPGLARFHRGDFIWGEALNALYNDSAIVLNLASWDSHLSGMTQRILEIPASGAFMLTDDSREARALFEPGREAEVFASPEELRRQCAHYLADGIEREAIAQRGHRRAQQQRDFGATARVLVGLAATPTVAAVREAPHPAMLRSRAAAPRRNVAA
ncbi:MAG: glycosyltransferase [Burkholderiales bacterium]